ncbi:MAG: glycosyl hydrolase, partial [Deinococcota bacterium]
YKGGMAALLTTDGPEKNTLQWAADGINFEIEAVIKGAPEALGLYRTPDHDKHPLEGLRWGLCHHVSQHSGHMGRFEVDETFKNLIMTKTTYE